jgi:S-phase kinase-associated protein 1
MIKLISQDEQSFEIDPCVANMSILLKNMIEDIQEEAPIPLPNVSGHVLEKVLKTVFMIPRL